MTSRPLAITFLASPEARLLLESVLAGEFAMLHGNPSASPLETLRTHEADLVLVDMDLPEVSGLEIICRIRKDPLHRELPIVGLGMEDGSGTEKVALVAGCTAFVRYPLQSEGLRGRLRGLLAGDRQELAPTERLRYYRLFAEVLIEKLERRLEALEKKNVALEAQRERQNQLTLQVLSSLVAMIEAKDLYLKGHSGRVTRYAVALGRRIGLAGEDLKTLERASLLHDIGKISIDLEQINKPGPLSTKEWDVIQLHPEIGYKILSSIDFLQDEALIVRYHHRHFSHFAGLPGIPSRIRTMTCILTLADSFDAMTTQRSYNVVRDPEDAMEEMRRCAGSHFDPRLVSAFVETLAGPSQAI